MTLTIQSCNPESSLNFAYGYVFYKQIYYLISRPLLSRLESSMPSQVYDLVFLQLFIHLRTELVSVQF